MLFVRTMDVSYETSIFERTIVSDGMIVLDDESNAALVDLNSK